MDELKQFLEETITPRVQGDGGWLDILSSDGNKIKVRLQGECSKCTVAGRCMKWIEEEIRTKFDREIEIEYERKKPFFWDTV